MIRRLRHPWSGPLLAVVGAMLLLMPTAIEYAVMLAGLSFNALD